jgi:class 3 adenylate cyclase
MELAISSPIKGVTSPSLARALAARIALRLSTLTPYGARWPFMTLASVRMNRVTLAFDDAEFERDFRDEYTDSVRLQVRRAYVAGIIGLAAIAIADLDTPVAHIARLIRYGFVFPAMLPALLATFTSTATFRRVGPALIDVGCVAILTANPALNVAILWSIAKWNPSDDLVTLFSLTLACVVAAVFAVLTVGSMRFWHATVAATLSVVAYLLTIAPIALRSGHPTFIAVAGTLAPASLVLGGVASYQLETFRRRLFLEQRQLALQHSKLGEERAKSDSLLRNILPEDIAERLKLDPSYIADGFSEVTVLFADIVGFTDLSTRLSPRELVGMLNRLFSAFDDLADKYGLEKIKTIGDAYMVVGGLPEARADHAEAVALMALEMRDAVARVAAETGYDLQVRIGASTGPVVAGVIGKKKFAYDLWGDAVNTASRMESHGLPGEIQVTGSTRAKLKDAFLLESRGSITVKGKGELPVWLVRGRK